MQKQDSRIFLLDAYALIYRAYYAFINNPRITTSGINTSATFGFMNFLLELLNLENPEYIAVVFDPDGNTFRHEAYPPYKAQRPPMPEALRNSIPYIKQLIPAMGIEMLEVKGYEADDVIGTIAKKAEKEGFEVYMITPDKDYAQLVSEKIFMLKPARSGGKSEIMGIAEVLDKFGIEKISQVIDILGLMGDVADNIPGCMGIGPKTASSLVYKYGDIDGIYDNIDRLKGKQKENLLNCRETVEMSRELVTINIDVPMDLKMDNLLKKPIQAEILKPILQELELFTLAKRITEVKLDDVSEEYEEVDIDYRDMTYAILELKSIIEEATEYSLFSIIDRFDVHTKLPTSIYFGLKDNRVFGVNLPNNKRDVINLIEPLRSIFEDEGKTVISNESKANMIWLSYIGINLRNKLYDITIAHYITHPDKNHELSRIVLEYLNYRTSADKEKYEEAQMSINFEQDDNQNKYAEDANAIFRLKELLHKDMQDAHLLELYNNIEIPLIPVLAAMEIEGVEVDKNELGQLSESIKSKLEDIENEIFAIAGKNFNISSPKQLGEILYQDLHIIKTDKKTKSGNYSTSEQILQKYIKEHPIIQKVLDYRGYKKLISTYTDSLPTYINPQTGRIHTFFNQTEASTGRLSCVNPNLQNIPIRTEEGRLIRRAFVCGGDDFVFLSADYSQIELRIMAHLSKSPELIDAFNHNIDVHTATASKIYHLPIERVDEDMRRKAKTANFGIIYGISAWGLSERLQITRKEGKELIDGYFEHYPGVKTYMDASIDRARKEGYVETIMGRRRYLRDINSRNPMVRGIAERNAINAPIQGSAADLIKMAMIEVDRRMKKEKLTSKMILQVHDELNFIALKSEKDKLIAIIKDAMENVVELSVPLTISIGEGNNWNEAH